MGSPRIAALFCMNAAASSAISRYVLFCVALYRYPDRLAGFEKHSEIMNSHDPRYHHSAERRSDLRARAECMICPWETYPELSVDISALVPIGGRLSRHSGRRCSARRGATTHGEDAPSKFCCVLRVEQEYRETVEGHTGTAGSKVRSVGEYPRLGALLSHKVCIRQLPVCDRKLQGDRVVVCTICVVRSQTEMPRFRLSTLG